MTIVAVTGGRDWKPGGEDPRELIRVLAYLGCRVLRHGTALGLDMWVDDIVKTYAKHIYVEPYPPDWGTYGSRAGPVRNGMMLRGEHGTSNLEFGKADVLLSYDGGKGTADCTEQAVDLWISVVRVRNGRADWDRVKAFLGSKR